MRAGERFCLHIELVDDAAVVRVSGELDVVTSPQLRDAVQPLLGTVAEVAFDFAKLRFIDSSGLAALARLPGVGGPPRVVIRGSSPMVRRVLEISQLSSLVAVED